MRQETQGVTETLIKNATEEFLEYGFTKASLRRIAGSSGVSTNSIYTRFKDKEGLFKAIVDDAAAGLMNIYLESIQKAKESTNLDQACLEGGQDKMTVDPFFIHVFCRAGWQTIYEVVMHNRTYKEAQSFMDSTVLFNRAGWKAVMGIEK